MNSACDIKLSREDHGVNLLGPQNVRCKTPVSQSAARRSLRAARVSLLRPQRGPNPANPNATAPPRPAPSPTEAFPHTCGTCHVVACKATGTRCAEKTTGKNVRRGAGGA